MNSSNPGTGWEEQSDADLLCALARQDPHALRELHRRYAPQLYALARREGLHDPERRVQDACLLILRHAHCHARTTLEARTWIIALARRALSSSGGPA